VGARAARKRRRLSRQAAARAGCRHSRQPVITEAGLALALAAPAPRIVVAGAVANLARGARRRRHASWDASRSRRSRSKALLLLHIRHKMHVSPRAPPRPHSAAEAPRKGTTPN